jgi:hypothetical protein
VERPLVATPPPEEGALVKQRGSRVALECPGILLPLFQGLAGVDELVAEGTALPPFAVHAPLMSLPGILGTTLANVPAQTPYLSVPTERVEHWRQVLGEYCGPDTVKVGIAWQGNRHHQWDRHRSVPLAHFAPLARVEGVRLISLQKGPGSEQLRAPANRVPVVDLGGEPDPATGFLDTAAIIRNLDLVITVDTAVAHLAGALDTPVWVVLSTIVDWRWLREREDTPWYPTMRLFRQEQLGAWKPVFERAAAELQALVAQQRRSSALLVEVSAGELLDKVSLHQIQAERLTDPEQRCHAHRELATLQPAQSQLLGAYARLASLLAELKIVNETRWDIEAELRRCEQAAEFGPRFIELARSVHRHKDHRAALKRRINELAGSPFSEPMEVADETAGVREDPNPTAGLAHEDRFGNSTRPTPRSTMELPVRLLLRPIPRVGRSDRIPRGPQPRVTALPART